MQPRFRKASAFARTPSRLKSVFSRSSDLPEASALHRKRGRERESERQAKAQDVSCVVCACRSPLDDHVRHEDRLPM